jgi:hypothetical protein
MKIITRSMLTMLWVATTSAVALADTQQNRDDAIRRVKEGVKQCVDGSKSKEACLACSGKCNVWDAVPNVIDDKCDRENNVEKGRCLEGLERDCKSKFPAVPGAAAKIEKSW